MQLASQPAVLPPNAETPLCTFFSFIEGYSVQIVYARLSDPPYLLERALAPLFRVIAAASSSYPCDIGLDLEWKPSFYAGYSSPICTFQFYVPEYCLVLHIPHYLKGRKKLPDSLVGLFYNTKVRLIVKNPSTDLNKLWAGYGIIPQNVYDLEQLLRIRNMPMNMEAAVSYIFGTKLQHNFLNIKSKRMAMSNWGIPFLSGEQIRYAAFDAWATLAIWNFIIFCYCYNINPPDQRFKEQDDEEEEEEVMDIIDGLGGVDIDDEDFELVLKSLKLKTAQSKRLMCSVCHWRMETAKDLRLHHARLHAHDVDDEEQQQEQPHETSRPPQSQARRQVQQQQQTQQGIQPLRPHVPQHESRPLPSSSSQRPLEMHGGVLLRRVGVSHSAPVSAVHYHHRSSNDAVHHQPGQGRPNNNNNNRQSNDSKGREAHTSNPNRQGGRRRPKGQPQKNGRSSTTPVTPPQHHQSHHNQQQQQYRQKQKHQDPGQRNNEPQTYTIGVAIYNK